MPGLIVVKRLIMQGFIYMDFADQNEQALADYDEAPVAEHLRGREIDISVDIGLGDGRATVTRCAHSTSASALSYGRKRGNVQPGF